MHNTQPILLTSILNELLAEAEFMGTAAVDSQLATMSPRHAMTQIPGKKDQDNLLKPYKFTRDKSSKQSNTMREKYRNANRKVAAPTTRLPLGY